MEHVQEICNPSEQHERIHLCLHMKVTCIAFFYCMFHVFEKYINMYFLLAAFERPRALALEDQGGH